jgi:hypothetical protein
MKWRNRQSKRQTREHKKESAEHNEDRYPTGYQPT